MSGPPSTCIRHAFAPSAVISERGDFLAILTISSGLSTDPLPTIKVAFPGRFTIVLRSIKSRFIFPTLASVITSPSINSPIHSEPSFQSESLYLACQANLSRLTRMVRSEFCSILGSAKSDIARLRGCSAKGSPTMLITRLPESLALEAISAAAPEPVPPPRAASRMTNSDFSNSGDMFEIPSLNLWAAKFGSAAAPFPLPEASKCRQCAEWLISKEDSSASISSKSESLEHLVWALDDHPQPMPPTPTIRIASWSMNPGNGQARLFCLIHKLHNVCIVFSRLLPKSYPALVSIPSRNILSPFQNRTNTSHLGGPRY